jgi:6-phosphogluconate dehydrogenase
LIDERAKASEVLKGPEATKFVGDKKAFIESIKKVPCLALSFLFMLLFFKMKKLILKALYASKIISYAQGFMLLKEAARINKWNLNYGGIALMWRGGKNH